MPGSSDSSAPTGLHFSLQHIKEAQARSTLIDPLFIALGWDVHPTERIVANVESMLALHRQLAAARSDAERDAIQRQIASTDRAIDQQVYAFYGLTPEEVAVVEGLSADR